VVLAWPAPTLSNSLTAPSYIARADIYRLIETRDQEPTLDPDDFEELAQLIGSLSRPIIEAQTKGEGKLQFADALKLNQPDVDNLRLRYAIRYVNAREQRSAFSNTVAIEPVARISLPPGELTVTAQDQDAITLEWKPPEGNIDGTTPASVIGYNVYRRVAARTAAARPLNEDPVTEARYVDNRFEYGVDYVYFVRALSAGTVGLIESADCNTVALTPVDTYPPSSPEPVSIASANGVISLFWPHNPERDVAGYNVYRAGAADAPDIAWTKLNPQPLSPVTFRDDTVVVDRKYFYRVTAVDQFKNESTPSKAVSEVARP
jgi:hypothetical protein